MTSRRAVLTAASATLLGACGAATQYPLLSQAPLVVRPVPTPPAKPLPPVKLPEDEAPHDVLAEWWYYTGHLFPEQPATPEEEYGFEFVFFRSIRGSRPPGYAAHFAVTDLSRGRFVYDQRQDVALNELPRPTAPGTPPTPGLVSLGPPTGGFDLLLGGWRMRGLNGRDQLSAAARGYGIDLQLTAQRPPALHLGDPPLQPGLISFGPAGYSYYYSRTRMEVAGTLLVDNGPPRPVRGAAWMDHQWGDFLVLGGGGWDWFAGQLADGRDLTISLVRDAGGAVILAYGTLVDASGESHHLAPADVAIAAMGAWTSPHTGVRYPSGWRVRVPAAGLDLAWTPVLQDQELDARASSGVVYWEGAVGIADSSSGAPAGRGYVELTGYTRGT